LHSVNINSHSTIKKRFQQNAILPPITQSNPRAMPPGFFFGFHVEDKNAPNMMLAQNYNGTDDLTGWYIST